MGRGLPELAQRSLEVVVLHGHVVVVGGQRALVLVQGGEAVGVGAPVIHVVAQQVAAAAQLHQCHGVGILGIEVGSAMIGHHHAAAQLAGEIGVAMLKIRGWTLSIGIGIVKLLGGDGIRERRSLEVESLVVVAGRLFQRALPEAVGIVAIEGQHLAVRHGLRQLRPASAGVEGQVEAYLQGDALQGHQIIARTTILVVELASHDRPAILPLQALHLTEDLPIQLFHQGEEPWVGTAGFYTRASSLLALGEHPVGDAAAARLAMAEGANAQHHRHVGIAAHLQETAKRALPIPTEDALLLLDMVPKHIGGDDGHAASLHLRHHIRPLIGRNARIVHFAHHRAHTATVNHQTVTIPRHLRDVFAIAESRRQQTENKQDSFHLIKKGGVKGSEGE